MNVLKKELDIIIREELVGVYKERLKELKSNNKKDLRREIVRLNKIIKNLEDKLEYYKGMNRSKCSNLGMMSLRSYINLQQQLEKAKNP